MGVGKLLRCAFRVKSLEFFGVIKFKKKIKINILSMFVCFCDNLDDIQKRNFKFWMSFFICLSLTNYCCFLLLP